LQLIFTLKEEAVIDFLLSNKDSSYLYERLWEMSHNFRGFDDMYDHVSEIIGNTYNHCLKQRKRDDIINIYFNNSEELVEIIGDLYDNDRDDFLYLQEIYDSPTRFTTELHDYLTDNNRQDECPCCRD